MGTRRRNTRRNGALRNGGNFRSYSQRHGFGKRSEKSTARPHYENRNYLFVGNNRMAGRHDNKYRAVDSGAYVRLRLVGVYLRASGFFHYTRRIYRGVETQRFAFYERFGVDMDGTFVDIPVSFVRP